MTDPTTTMHIDPGTLRLLWAALCTAALALGAAIRFGFGMLRELRARVRQSDREQVTDDLVHGVDQTQKTPDKDAPGLAARVAQLEDVTTELAHGQAYILKVQHLPDPSDREAMAAVVAEHLDTQRLQVLTDERTARRGATERAQEPPAPRPRPDGRHRGEPE